MISTTGKGEAKLGTVTSVYSDQGLVQVDVTMPRPGAAHRRVPFHQLAPGLIVTPAIGEQVVVVSLDDGSKRAMFPQGHPEYEMPVMGEGELCFRFDDDTEIRVQQTGSGYDVRVASSADFELAMTGSASVSAGGDVAVDATGDVSVTTESDCTVTAQNVTTTATGAVTVNSGDVRLGGAGGSRVAREGDAVRVYAPEHGWIDGVITSGSSVTTTF